MTNMQWTRDTFTITTDSSRFDVAAIHRFLHASYWAKNIPLETVQRSIDNSIGFAILEGNTLVGFARIITDKATYAYLADVFVLDPWRGQGLSKWLMEVITTYPDIQGVRSFYLLTDDAHGLYEQFGWQVYNAPHKVMKRSTFTGYP